MWSAGTTHAACLKNEVRAGALNRIFSSNATRLPSAAGDELIMMHRNRQPFGHAKTRSTVGAAAGLTFLHRFAGRRLVVWALATLWVSMPGIAAAEAIFSGLTVKTVSVITYDVEKTAKRYAVVFGAKNWSVFDDDVELTTFGGGKVSKQHIQLRTAIGQLQEGLQIELIQGTPGTPFGEFMIRRGEPGGVLAHHFGLGAVPDANELLRRLKAEGYGILMQLRTVDGAVTTLASTWNEIGSPVAFSSVGTNPSARKPSRSLKFDDVGYLKVSKPLEQLAFYSNDIDSMQKHYKALFGIDQKQYPIALTEFVEYDVLLKGPLKIKFGIGMLGSMQMELVEPVFGDTIYSKWVRKNGVGIQHMSFGVVKASEYGAIVDAFESAGYRIHFTGLTSAGAIRFGFADTFDLGMDIEFAKSTGPEAAAPATR